MKTRLLLALVSLMLLAVTARAQVSAGLMRDLMAAGGRRPLLALDASLELQLAAPTNAPAPGGASTVPGGNPIVGLFDSAGNLLAAGVTNAIVVVGGSYSPTLHGGGFLGLYWPVVTNGVAVYLGARLQYIASGLVAPEGTVTLGVPESFKIGTVNISITPLVEAAIAVPISGQTIGGVTVPGHVLPNEFPITGEGAWLDLYSSGRFKVGVIGLYEQWHQTSVDYVLNGGLGFVGVF